MPQLVLRSVFGLLLLAFLPSQPVRGEELYRNPHDAAYFELGKPQIKTDGSGNRIVILSYKAIQKSTITSERRLAGHSSNSKLFPNGGPVIKGDSGAIVLDRFAWDISGGVNLELYLVQSYKVSFQQSVTVLASNQITIGNPGAPTPTLDLNLHSGHQTWNQPNAITSPRPSSRASKKPTPQASKKPTSNNQSTARPPLAKRIRRSFPIRIPLPVGWMTVPERGKVAKGTRLQYCRFSRWHFMTVLEESTDGPLDVDSKGASGKFSISRDEAIILDPNAEPPKPGDPVPPLRAKNYTVSIDIPDDSVRVPDDAILTPGTKLQACYARRWNPITFLSHATDGTLNVHWDDYGSSFDCSVRRDQLIIKKALLGK